MHTPLPLVTILSLAYNHERFVAEAIASVLAQSHGAFEMLILDNASADGTLAAARAAIPPGETRIQVIASPENLGIARGLAALLPRAGGKYVTLLSADDRLRPEKLAAQVALAESRAVPTVVSCDVALIDVEGKVTTPHVSWETPAAQHDLVERLMRTNLFFAMAPLFPASALAAVGGFDVELDFEDHDLWRRLAMHGPWVHVHEPLAEYREVPGSAWRSMGPAKFWRSDALSLLKAFGYDRRTSFAVLRGLGAALYRLRRLHPHYYAEVRERIGRDLPFPYAGLVRGAALLKRWIAYSERPERK